MRKKAVHIKNTMGLITGKNLEDGGEEAVQSYAI